MTHPAEQYHAAGWAPLPLPAGQKWPPPEGHTGYAGRYPDAGQIQRWIDADAYGNVALRLPPDVVGVDADLYKDPGALARLEERFGTLPPTLVSTSRTDGSGIRLYRVPVGTTLDPNPADAVEIVQAHHRYVVAWPSVHPEGRPYLWVDQGSGEVLDGAPDLDELPELPWSWQEGLARASSGKLADRAATPAEVVAFVDAHASGSRPEALGGIRTALATRTGSRHDTLVSVACWAMREARAGYYPAAAAIEEIAAWWHHVMDDAGRRDGDELGNALSWAVAEATSAPDERIADLEARPRHDPLAGLTVPQRPATSPDVAQPAPDGSEEAPATPPGPQLDRFEPGGQFILDGPDEVEAIWGTGQQVAWSAGEPFDLVGPPGVGKTTLIGQVLAGRLGILDEVLELPIVQTGSKVLYLASDRPQQIRRALRRLFDEQHRQVLDERLVIWRGPPPGDVAANPGLLLTLCEAAGCDTVFIDSLKDIAMGLSEDAVGAAVNIAIQTVIAAGIEVCVLHHQRKGQGGEKPKKLEDVYGSTWITAGAGSVILLWGSAGDPLVELEHLKQPAEPLGPWKLEHDHLAGTTQVVDRFNLEAWLAGRPDGATAADLAYAEFGIMPGATKAAEAGRKKAQRRLDGLVKDRKARRVDASKGGRGGSQPARWYWIDALDALGYPQERSTDMSTDTGFPQATDVNGHDPQNRRSEQRTRQRTSTDASTDTFPPSYRGEMSVAPTDDDEAPLADWDLFDDGDAAPTRSLP